MNSLREKNIVVSGAAHGIGTAIVKALLEEGAYPLCIDIAQFTRTELKKTLRGKAHLGKDFTYIQGDAGNEFLMQDAFRNVDRIDGLVNNAGLLGGDKTHGGRNIKALQKMFKAHVYTAFVLTEICAERMPAGSSIVNIGSIELIAAAPEVVQYTAAKGALWGMTVSYATTLASKGIRVNTVSPGDVATQRNIAQYTKNATARQHIEHFRKRTPLEQRSVYPKEIADAVLFLLSEKSRAITGQDIVVDLGHTRALVDPSWYETSDGSQVYG